MVKLEIKIDKRLLNDILKEKKMLSCIKDNHSDIPYDFANTLSEEFLLSILSEYEKQQPTDYLKIKISPQND